jgi:hypothetical protein
LCIQHFCCLPEFLVFFFFFGLFDSISFRFCSLRCCRFTTKTQLEHLLFLM